jgi:hypothetical protein
MIESIRRLRASEPVRLYLYGVGLALVALLVAYGIVAAEFAPLWVALLVALLGVPATESARRAVSPSGGGAHRREG